MEVAIIGGEPHRFRSMINLYREAARHAGHPQEQIKVGIHSPGFLADTTAQAADDWFPSYAHVFTQIGKERGWPPTTRAQFDASRTATGALLIGDPDTVTEKILYENDILGGISRFNILLTPGSISHKKVMHAIELLGTRVAPVVKKEIAGSLVGAGVSG